ncbi:MAG TPA: exonuclease domain-containing protein [Roseiarcus sp.]
MSSFVFYDTETTGTDTAFDQILQFAAIQTDENLRELDRFEIRCRLLPHVVPAAGALITTGVSPSLLTDSALPTHYEAARQIARRLADWSPSIFLGYNSMSFDEELLRQTFYQTLQPIYVTNTNGNTRGDILSLVNASMVVAPTALTIPIGTSGKQTRKLDTLAPANGYAHPKAHDALADVEATIFLAKVIRGAAPAVWEEFIRLRSKPAVIARLSERGPFYQTEFYGTTPAVIPLTGCGTAPGADSLGCAFDLRYDPRDYLRLDEEELPSVMNGRKKALRYVPSNKQPMLLASESSFALPYAAADRDEFRSRADLIYRSQDFRARACRALSRQFSDRPQGIHVEQRIHEQFFSSADAALLSSFHDVDWVARGTVVEQLADDRLRELGKRLIFVEKPDVMDVVEKTELETWTMDRLFGFGPEGPRSLDESYQEVCRLIETEGHEQQSLLTEIRVWLSEKLATAPRIDVSPNLWHSLMSARQDQEVEV